MQNVTHPNREVQFYRFFWVSDHFLRMDSVRVINFHLASTAAENSVQKSSTYLSPEPRNLGGELGSCTSMEAKMVRIHISIINVFRIPILPSDSCSAYSIMQIRIHDVESIYSFGESDFRANFDFVRMQPKNV